MVLISKDKEKIKNMKAAGGMSPTLKDFVSANMLNITKKKASDSVIEAFQLDTNVDESSPTFKEFRFQKQD